MGLTANLDDAIVVERSGTPWLKGTNMNVSNGCPTLRAKLGGDGFLELRGLLDGEKKQWREEVLETAVDRFERRLSEELGRLRAELVKEIAAARDELIKLSFLFWVGQLAAMTAIMSFLLRNVSD